MTISFTLILFTAVYIYFDRRNYYAIGESDTFNLSTGDSFTIKIERNGSTGYSNCWTNENECQHVKLIDRQYNTSVSENFGAIGAAATEQLTFKVISIGLDTIKITSIPPGFKCGYADTITANPVEKMQVVPDNIFVIKAKD